MTKHMNAVSKPKSAQRPPSMASTEPVGIVGWTEILVFFASLFSKFVPIF